MAFEPREILICRVEMKKVEDTSKFLSERCNMKSHFFIFQLRRKVTRFISHIERKNIPLSSKCFPCY